MNNLLGPGLAIVATIVLLLLRELILLVGKKDTNRDGVRDHRPGVPDPEYEHSPRVDASVEFDEAIPGATPIAVDEFLDELRARAQEHSRPSLTGTGSMTAFGGAQSNRNEMTEETS
jgi:hypothetical protein